MPILLNGEFLDLPRATLHPRMLLRGGGQLWSLHIVVFEEVQVDVMADGDLAKSAICTPTDVVCLDVHPFEAIELRFSPPNRKHSAEESHFLQGAVSTLRGTESGPKLGAVCASDLIGGKPSPISHEAPAILHSCQDIRSFKGPASECCVARKAGRARPSRRCPPVRGMFRVDAIFKRCSNGDPAWRQSAATFSTMMRFFQKARPQFCWATGTLNQTTIALCAR